MLYYTSFLFGTVAYHASKVKNEVLHVLFMFMYGVSILNHSHYVDPNTYPGGTMVSYSDIILAHTIVAYVSWFAYTNPRWNKLSYKLFWLCDITTGLLYYTKIKNSTLIYQPYVIYGWHMCMHIVSSLGMHAYLIAYRR